MRLGVLSDLHCEIAPRAQRSWINRYDADGVLARAGEALDWFRGSGVELIVVAGDVVEAVEEAAAEAACSALAAASAPVVVVGGNHDWDAADLLRRTAAAHGIRFLDTAAAGDGVAVVGVTAKTAPSGPTLFEGREPPVGDGTRVVVSHFPVLSEAERLASARLPYPGDLINRADLERRLVSEGVPVVVLNGHIHARCSRSSGAILQLSAGSLIESPYDAAIVTIAPTPLTVEREIRRLRAAAPLDPVFAPELERWEWRTPEWTRVAPQERPRRHRTTAVGGAARTTDPLDFDGLIVDLDGVVWLGSRPVPGSVAALAELRARGVRLVFLTNDPRGTRAEYLARLRRIGVDATEAQIVTAGRALAELVAEREGLSRRVFAIGSPSLKDELADVGLTLVQGASGRDADVVAIGGHDAFDYDELRIATQAIRGGASLYAAGRDPTFPMPDGPWPATGAILAAVETAGGRRAVVVGKPEPHIFGIALSRLDGCDRIAVVGDHLEADVAGGKRAGLTTILVLSGTASAADVATAKVQPDVVLADLAALVQA